MGAGYKLKWNCYRCWNVRFKTVNGFLSHRRFHYRKDLNPSHKVYILSKINKEHMDWSAVAIDKKLKIRLVHYCERNQKTIGEVANELIREGLADLEAKE